MYILLYGSFFVYVSRAWILAMSRDFMCVSFVHYIVHIYFVMDICIHDTVYTSFYNVFSHERITPDI